ncbi:MAG: YaeP family protein [Aeromonadaceae bacterium]
MKYLACCEKVREAYSQIGGGDLGYIAKAITAAIQALDEIAADESLPETVRNKAAYAAANLLMSDYNDNDA